MYGVSNLYFPLIYLCSEHLQVAAFSSYAWKTNVLLKTIILVSFLKTFAKFIAVILHFFCHFLCQN